MFNPLTLTIGPGETKTIMGPSGCGKSTLLAAVAGSLDPVFSFHGDILLNQQNLNQIPMEQRNIGMLFQDDLLFPHMSIGANLSFGIPHSIKGPERDEMVRKALGTAGLDGYENRDPATLSGGQKARVSLLRSLLAGPSALLLDEPFSRLDQKLKEKIRAFVFSQVKAMNIPALLVSHDPDDCPAGGTIIHLVED